MKKAGFFFCTALSLLLLIAADREGESPPQDLRLSPRTAFRLAFTRDIPYPGRYPEDSYAGPLAPPGEIYQGPLKEAALFLQGLCEGRFEGERVFPADRDYLEVMLEDLIREKRLLSFRLGSVKTEGDLPEESAAYLWASVRLNGKTGVTAVRIFLVSPEEGEGRGYLVSDLQGDLRLLDQDRGAPPPFEPQVYRGFTL
ncbi:MAG: hypothetical protein LBQ61_08110 [Spirochaetales bacterium]|jgi:hypothetical protein|nr:hypothetical protein [Spirochaetales bacterium]